MNRSTTIDSLKIIIKCEIEHIFQKSFKRRINVLTSSRLNYTIHEKKTNRQIIENLQIIPMNILPE